MRIAYTPEQERLRLELRDYFGPADDGRGAGRDRRSGRGRLRRRRRLPRGRAPARPGRLAGAELAAGARRARRNHDRPAHLHRRGGGRAGAGAVPDRQHGRADDHAVRHPGPEVVLPAPDRRGRDPLLRRLLGTGGRDRPGVPADDRDPRRRRLRDRRPEDVDEPDPVRRLRVARLPDRSGRAPAPGAVDRHRADHRRGLLVDAGAHAGRRDDERHLLLVGPGSGLLAGGRGEPGLAADHQPAQPRAGGADLGRAGAFGARVGPGVGDRDQAGGREPGHRRTSGCGCTWPGCTPRRSSSS